MTYACNVNALRLEAHLGYTNARVRVLLGALLQIALLTVLCVLAPVPFYVTLVVAWVPVALLCSWATLCGFRPRDFSSPEFPF